MKCFYHNERDAVGSCKQCGKAACRDCIDDAGGALLCKDCAPVLAAEAAAEARQEAIPLRRAIRTGWMIAAAAFIVMLPVAINDPQMNTAIAIGGAAGGAYIFWAWYWGYKAFSRWQPNVLLSLRLFGWFMLFTFKSALGGTYGILGGGIREYMKYRRALA